jgi:hypothetical protein
MMVATRAVKTMWMLLPAISLAIVQIAGDNVAVVPDMASVIGTDIYSTIIVAYVILGSLITGISAWIGVQTGQELIIVVKKYFGCTGKNTLAAIILATCIPASAITGCYFAGWVLHLLTGIPILAAGPVCLLFFTLMAAGYGFEFLKLSNYLALFLLPVVGILFFQQDSTNLQHFFDMGAINWPLAFALIGYNSGGMRSILVVEAAALLSKKGDKAVFLAVMSKVVEGLFTVGVAHLVLFAGAAGPLALSQVVHKFLGTIGFHIFNLILLCTFMNTMVPAMIVNARQISIITDLPIWPSLGLSMLAVYLVSLVNFNTLLMMMSWAGLITIGFLVYTAWFLHKQRINK